MTNEIVTIDDLVVVFTLQTTSLIHPKSAIELVQQEIDQWMWEEVVNVSQNENINDIDEELTFVAFVELD